MTMGGKQRRRKGGDFERDVARLIRARWPLVQVRRASQAERAHESDVYITGHPDLERLWLELQDARKPTPLAKLAQAERDIVAVRGVGGRPHFERYPVVVWHRIRERTIQATTRAWVFDELRNSPSSDDTVITMDLGAFLDVVGKAAA